MLKIEKIVPPIASLMTVDTEVICTENGCNSIFKSKSNLNMHILRHHKKEILKPNNDDTIFEYHCPVKNCSYNITQEQSFTTLKYLKQHYLKVHSPKDILCEKCNRKFATEANKKKHDQFCGIEFTCLDCSYKYPTFEALMTHCKRKNHRYKEKLAYLQTTQSVPVESLTTNSNNNNNVVIIVEKEKPVFILPRSDVKVLSDASTQTDKLNCRKSTRIVKKSKNTNLKTIETQTSGDLILKRAMEIANIPQKQRKKLKNQNIHTQTCATTNTVERATEPCKELAKIFTDNSVLNFNVTDNSTSTVPLNVNVDLNDIWNDSGTQTSPLKNDLNFYNDSTSILEKDHYNYNCFDHFTRDRLISNNDNKLCNIETQTDINNLLLANTDFFRASLTNMYTQTGNSSGLLDLELNDIETQTAWPAYNDELAFVSTETQTSSLVAELNHSQTQTDLGLSTFVSDIS